MRSAKVSTAHATTSRAGASARSFAACAACAASACRRAASSASPAVTCSGYVGLVALNLTGRLPSVKRSRSRPYSPCNHMPRRKCSHEPTPAGTACGSSGVSRKSPDHTHSPHPGGPGPAGAARYPCRIQAMSGSGGLTGGLCWQSHQLPPGHSSWCAARQAEQTMMPLWAVVRGARSRAHQRGWGGRRWPNGMSLRRRWHGASGGAVRRPSPPHSGHPRCRTFLAGKRHK